jgi:hypothetical protein
MLNALVNGLFPITWWAVVDIDNYLTGTCPETKIIRYVAIEIPAPLGSDKPSTESSGNLYNQAKCYGGNRL